MYHYEVAADTGCIVRLMRILFISHSRQSGAQADHNADRNIVFIRACCKLTYLSRMPAASGGYALNKFSSAPERHVQCKMIEYLISPMFWHRCGAGPVRCPVGLVIGVRLIWAPKIPQSFIPLLEYRWIYGLKTQSQA